MSAPIRLDGSPLQTASRVTPAPRRRFLIVLLVLVCGPAPAADIPALVRMAKPAVVQLLCYDQDDQLVASGTGFFISPDGKLLTNYHVIADAQSIIAKSDTRRYRLKRILIADEDHDVAELQFATDRVPYLTLGSSSYALQGERVLVIGNPEDLEGTVSDGIISAFRGHRSMIQITAPISPGSSGSPVIDQESGEVIGIAELVNKEGQNLNFAVSADTVRDAIAKDSSHAQEPSLEELVQEASRRAWAMLDKKDYVHAKGFFNRIVLLQPDNPKAYCGRGIVHGWLKEYEAAINDFTKALQLKPDYAAAYAGRAVDYYLLGRHADAIKDQTEVIRLKPNDATFYRFRATVYDAAGNHARAEEDRKKAKELMRR
jgi:tetratricopeptide (TPR) repeat protein